jgi:hypothetical protein
MAAKRKIITVIYLEYKRERIGNRTRDVQRNTLSAGTKSRYKSKVFFHRKRAEEDLDKSCKVKQNYNFCGDITEGITFFYLIW